MDMRALLLVGLSVLTCAACGHSMRSAAREASGAAVDRSVERVTEKDTQQDLAEAARDPDVERAATRLSSRIAEGILQGFSSEQAQARLASVSDAMVAAAMRQMVSTLGSDRTQIELANVVGSVADSTLAQLTESLRAELGPALRAAIREDVARGIEEALKGEGLQTALGDTSRNLAYHAVVGANQGVDAIWTGRDGALADVRGVVGLGRTWLWLMFAALGLLTLVLLSAAVIAVARTRRARAEVARLESATLLLATAMRERHASQETDNIVAIVQQSLEKSAQQHPHGGLWGTLRMWRH